MVATSKLLSIWDTWLVLGTEVLILFQFCSVSQSCLTLLQVYLSITSSWSLLKLMSTESVIPSNHLILCHPLLLLPSIFPSIKAFPVSQFFVSRGQSIGISASASALPKNIQDWFPLGLTGLISLQCIAMYSCSNEDIEKVDGSFFSKLRLCKTRTIKGEKTGSRGYFQGYVRMISLRI